MEGQDNSAPGAPDVGNNAHDGSLQAAIEAEERAMERAQGQTQEPRKRQQQQQQPQDEGNTDEGDRPDDGSEESDQPDADNQDEPDQDAEAAADDEQQDDGEYLELEHEGQKYRVPKELEGALMMRADYQRKTQELAQQRTQVESDRQQVRAMFDATGPYLQRLAQRNLLAAQHQELMTKTNWAELEQHDQVQYGQLGAKASLLANQIGRLDQELAQTQHQLQLHDQQQAEQRLQEAHQVMQRIWPDFTQADAQRLGQFGRACGMRQETIAYLDQGHDPVAMRLLDFAMRHVVAVRDKPAALKKVAAAKPMNVKPGASQGVQTQGVRNVQKFGQRLKATGSFGDAVALELAHEQRRSQRRR